MIVDELQLCLLVMTVKKNEKSTFRTQLNEAFLLNINLGLHLSQV